MINYPRGLVGKAQHRDWLNLVNPEGPFLSTPVLNQVFPNGIDRPEQRSADIANLMDAHKLWRKKAVEQHEAWIRAVLTIGAKWPVDQLLHKVHFRRLVSGPVFRLRALIFVTLKNSARAIQLLAELGVRVFR